MGRLGCYENFQKHGMTVLSLHERRPCFSSDSTAKPERALGCSAEVNQSIPVIPQRSRPVRRMRRSLPT
ncbi:hypothetical protein PAXRUDRAFT_509379 [Paxillus rubicundulus Ve08.2h10]|uniref:Uncharacterized protein n=1 Tax=Paxillus rubicundulus Ve08.2h10 TaxID=930991 RepID=A0A0D0DVJ1_9AGAM|nr:hypothetical protein PAXRUDRAFT_509379 [Paxillus rubicundulus Ve08.2h10]